MQHANIIIKDHKYVLKNGEGMMSSLGSDGRRVMYHTTVVIIIVSSCRIFTLYTRTLPLDVACRVWDMFCRDGEVFLFRTALGVCLCVCVCPRMCMLMRTCL